MTNTFTNTFLAFNTAKTVAEKEGRAYLDDIGGPEHDVEALHAPDAVTVVEEHHIVPLLLLAHAPRGDGVR